MSLLVFLVNLLVWSVHSSSLEFLPSKESTQSHINNGSTHSVNREPEPNNIGRVLLTLTALILLLPFLGIFCYLLNVRYRFLIFDLFFKRRRPDESLQCRRISLPGSFYERLEEADIQVDGFVNQKLLKLYPEVHRFGHELPSAFRLQKNLQLAPNDEPTLYCSGSLQEEESSKMEAELFKLQKTKSKMTKPFGEGAGQYSKLENQ